MQIQWMLNFGDGAYLFHKSGESFRIFHSHLRKNFAINLNFFVSHDFDELAVFDAKISNGNIKASNPKSSHCSFLDSSVSEGI